MAITRFEDIRAWQNARELAKVVYEFSGEEGFNRDFALRDQIRRSAVSMRANVAEGFDSRSNGEFIQFLYYALRSASELQSHCYVAMDQRYISRRQLSATYAEVSNVKKMIFRFIEYLRDHERSRTSSLACRTSNHS